MDVNDINLSARLNFPLEMISSFRRKGDHLTDVNDIHTISPIWFNLRTRVFMRTYTIITLLARIELTISFNGCK